MIRVFCNRCGKEIDEEDEGIPVDLLPEDVDGVELGPEGVGQVLPQTGRILFVVVNDEDEPVDDISYCMACVRAMMDEFAASKYRDHPKEEEEDEE